MILKQKSFAKSKAPFSLSFLIYYPGLKSGAKDFGFAYLSLAAGFA